MRIRGNDRLLFLGVLRDGIDGHFAEEAMDERARGRLDRTAKPRVQVAIPRDGAAQNSAKHFELADQLIDLIAVRPANTTVSLGIVFCSVDQRRGVASAQEGAALLIYVRQVIDELPMSQPIRSR